MNRTVLPRQAPCMHTRVQNSLRTSTRLAVYAPTKEETPNSSMDPRDYQIAGSVSISDIQRPVADDMRLMVTNLKSVVGDRHPMLMAAAEQIFGAGGKRLRPMLVFLVAHATSIATHQGCDFNRRVVDLRPMHVQLHAACRSTTLRRQVAHVSQRWLLYFAVGDSLRWSQRAATSTAT